MLKVLYLCPNATIGGAEKVLLSLVDGHRRGSIVNPQVVLFRKGDMEHALSEIGVRPYIFKSPPRFSRPWTIIKALCELRQFYREFSPDVVHATMGQAAILMGLSLAFFSGKSPSAIKKVWFQHGPIVYLWDQLAALFSFDLIFFNSSYLIKDHYQHIKHCSYTHRTVQINLGVSLAHSHFKEVEKIRQLFVNAGPLAKRKILFTCVGRIVSGKGAHVILLALAYVQKELAKRNLQLHEMAHLLIVGAPGLNPGDQQYFKEISHWIEKNKWQSWVTIMPFRKDIQNIHAASDVLIQSTQFAEPFGLSVAEALLSGCPVIGPNFGGVTQILIDQNTGWTFSSNDPKAEVLLAEKILPLVLHPEIHLAQLKSLAKRGQELVAKSYNFNQMIDSVEREYQNLIES